jgi:hypothetical protein
MVELLGNGRVYIVVDSLYESYYRKFHYYVVLFCMYVFYLCIFFSILFLLFVF